MKITISIDRLLDLVNESLDATNDYCLSSKRYYRKHGYGVYLDRVKTAEERHIAYACHRDEASRDVVSGITEVFRMDADQIKRLYSAARFARKWYERTNWERLLPEELCNRIETYVFNG